MTPGEGRGMKQALMALLIGFAPTWALGGGSSPDESFYKSAAEGGLAEVAAGKLAENKGTTAALKDFGGMMVKDHSTADQRLWALASSKDVKMPTTPSVEQLAAAERLKPLSGSSFDKAYIRSQIDAHRDAIALLKKEISSGRDPQAKQFAQSILSTVQAHLDTIMTLAKQAGVSSG
jgi:putative membrane protein